MPNETTAPQKIPRLSPSSNALGTAKRWQIIANRDTTADTFVYAVLTTKIYCRPSCPARLARRANVRFYDTPSQAEGAGFRPCKRCRPHSGRTAAQSNPHTAMVEKACETIREDLATGLKPRLQDLAVRAGLTPSHFHRVFKKRMGVTPGEYARRVVQDGAGVSPDSMTPGSVTPDSISELATPPCGSVDGRSGGVLARDGVESVALPVAGLPEDGMGDISFGGADDIWNDFDLLLAAEQEQPLLADPFSIDPRILSSM